MQHRRLSFFVDWLLLFAGFVTFSSGLVLLICFHMGHGAWATTALGVSRLVWTNLHRITAILMLAGVVTHVGLHFKTFKIRFKNVIAPGAKRPINSELIMYVVAFVAVAAALVAWWVIGGASPLRGPVVMGRLSNPRHLWIDTHHFSSLLLLVLVSHHVGHRRRFLFRRPRAALATA